MQIHLNTKSHYSILKSTLKIDDIINYALLNNQEYVCLCDINFFGSSLEFIKKAQANKLKPVVSIEVQTMLCDEKLTCILTALNNDGMQSLKKLSSAVLTSKDTLLTEAVFLDNLTGINVCVDLINSQLYQNYLINNEIKIEYLKKLEQHLPLTYYLSSNNLEFKKAILDKQIPLVAALPIYCLSKDDSDLLYLLECIDLKKDADEFELTNRIYYGLADQNQYELEELANLKNLISLVEDYHLKKYDSLPDYKADSDQYLSNLAMAGLNKRLHNQIPSNYLERLKYELKTIIEMGYSNYFLIVYDYVLFAKRNDILVGPGRGSSAGSLVAYCLGITEIDPIKNKLLFERFLNPERINLPDIDVDFQDDKRHEVIAYLRAKYGPEHVAHIITYGTFKAKNSLNDMARIFKVPEYEIKKVSRLIKSHYDLKDFINKSRELTVILNSNLKLKQLYYYAMRIQGLNRNYSTHAAGIIITKEELINYGPIIKYSEDNTYTIQYTMDYLEDIGLYKMDILGLKTLTILNNIIKQIDSLKLSEIPLNDANTLALLNQGATLGVFQFESHGVMQVLKQMQINHLDDLIATTSLYRPGPGEFIREFIDRKTGFSRYNYIHPDLQDILEPTYGIIVYQEQIMQITQKLAGFGLAKADIIRKGMAKKNEKILTDIKNDFVSSSIKNGYSAKVAMAVFDMIFKFSNYGFNKSHAAAYALLGYYMAYLKANYPHEFFTSMLTSSIDDISSLRKYSYDMQAFGLKLVVPNLNESSSEVKRNNNEYILPFTAIKGIGKVQAQLIIDEQQTKQFDNYLDSVLRLLSIGINLKTIEKLIYAGCFDIFDYNRNTMVENLVEIEKYFNIIFAQGQQISLDDTYVNPPRIIKYAFNKNIFEKELEVLGLYISDHPLKIYEERYPHCIINNINENKHMVVQIDSIKEIRTKKGELMAYFNVSDQISNVSVTIFANTYSLYRNKFKPKDIILVTGNLDLKFGNVLAKSIKLLNR